MIPSEADYLKRAPGAAHHVASDAKPQMPLAILAGAAHVVVR